MRAAGPWSTFGSLNPRSPPLAPASTRCVGATLLPAMDNHVLHQAISDALAASLAPYVAQLEARLAAVEDCVAANVPRRPITESIKRRHRGVLAALGGRCPCCGVARVLDDDGRVVAAEWDHFFSRERRGFTEVWLVWRPCHLRMVDRTRYAPAFEAFQLRAETVEAGQLALFA